MPPDVLRQPGGEHFQSAGVTVDQNHSSQQAGHILSTLVSAPPPENYPPALLLLLYAPPILIVLIAFACFTKLLLRRVVRKWLCRRHHNRQQSLRASPPMAGSGAGVTPCVRLAANNAQRIFIVRAPAANFPLPAHFLPPNLWAFPPPTVGSQAALGLGAGGAAGGALPLPSGALQGYWREDIVEQVISSFPPKYEEAMRVAHQQHSNAAAAATTRRGRRRQAAQQRRQQHQQQPQVVPMVHPIQVVVSSPPPPFYSRQQSATRGDARVSPPAYVQTLPGEPVSDVMPSYMVEIGTGLDTGDCGDGDEKAEINETQGGEAKCEVDEEPSISAENDEKELDAETALTAPMSTRTIDDGSTTVAFPLADGGTDEVDSQSGVEENTRHADTNRVNVSTSPRAGHSKVTTKGAKKKAVRRCASLATFRRRTSFPTTEHRRCAIGRRSAEDSGGEAAEF